MPPGTSLDGGPDAQVQDHEDQCDLEDVFHPEQRDRRQRDHDEEAGDQERPLRDRVTAASQPSIRAVHRHGSDGRGEHQRDRHTVSEQEDRRREDQ